MNNDVNPATRLASGQALNELVTFFEDGISWQARLAMREYTSKELDIYNNIMLSVKAIEESGFDVKRGHGPWDIYGPYSHKSEKASNNLDPSKDETEVWSRVRDRVIKNKYTTDDEDYMAEIERRSNGLQSIIKIQEENKIRKQIVVNLLKFQIEIYDPQSSTEEVIILEDRDILHLNDNQIRLWLNKYSVETPYLTEQEIVMSVIIRS